MTPHLAARLRAGLLLVSFLPAAAQTRGPGAQSRALMARPGSVRATEELARLAEAEARVGRN